MLPVRTARLRSLMITCDRCKTENLDGSQYCDECGAPLRPNNQLGTLQSPSHGQNGSHASFKPRPEYAAGHISASFNINPVPPSTKPHARLVIEKGRSTGKQFMLSDVEAQIGRWDADAGIFPDVDLDTDDPEAKVSRRHARITLTNGQYFVEDLGSTNGTFINRGKRLPPGQRQALCDGDEIIVGKTFLRFHIVK
ncbi:MAG: FHA domain-containing protein [Pyrinomonadaceae bacterium]